MQYELSPQEQKNSGVGKGSCQLATHQKLQSKPRTRTNPYQKDVVVTAAHRTYSALEFVAHGGTLVSRWTHRGVWRSSHPQPLNWLHFSLLCAQDEYFDVNTPKYQECLFAVLGLMMNLLLESNAIIQVCKICERSLVAFLLWSLFWRFRIVWAVGASSSFVPVNGPDRSLWSYRNIPIRCWTVTNIELCVP